MTFRDPLNPFVPVEPALRPEAPCSTCGYHYAPASGVCTKCGTLHPQGQPEAQEPDRVKVARAVGFVLGESHEWDESAEGYRQCQRCKMTAAWSDRTADAAPCLPDFAADPAFTVRMMNANGLGVNKGITGWVVGRPCGDEVGEGEDVGHAVVRWIIAAAEGGVEIKR